jgi:hypothetical protein
MGRVVFGTDYWLRDGEEVLAEFRADSPYGCILAWDRDYEIAHRGRTRWGWRFYLVDRVSGDNVCEYEPYPVIRGGRLRGSYGIAILRGVPLRARRWTFVSESTGPLDAVVSDVRVSQGFYGDLREGWRARRERRRLRREGLELPPATDDDAPTIAPRAMSCFQIELSGSDLPTTPEASIVLAFVCWILAERQSVLNSPANPS